MLLVSCGSVNSEPEDALRVLFIGNSLTYANDLPAMVAAMSVAEEERPLVYGMVTFPDYSLEDHWNKGTARDALADGSWDIVVMQQGPSSLPENKELLIRWTRKFADEARAHGTEPALFTVWPSSSRSFAFPAVINSYAAAADSVDGLVLPAGSAWLAAWKRDPTLSLYGPDDFHPSELGSYLCALVIYSVLYDRAPRGLPTTFKVGEGHTIRVSPGTARLLQDAAAEAILESQ
ncbi:SGNH/GDSL hydrolase family protein [Bacteroidota bacterium]